MEQGLERDVARAGEVDGAGSGGSRSRDWGEMEQGLEGYGAGAGGRWIRGRREMERELCREVEQYPEGEIRAGQGESGLTERRLSRNLVMIIYSLV